MTINEANGRLLAQLQQLYDPREAANIADLVMENLTGLPKIGRIAHKNDVASFTTRLDTYIKELKDHRPVQYVLGEAWFFGMRFFVNEDVLIPRPETEELIQWVFDENNGQINIFDVGSGSGCIPIILKKKLPHASIVSCDVSEAAIAVAARNARALDAHVEYMHLDILDRAVWNRIPSTDIIVSNPPYIPATEATLMSENVVSYEPHHALFVADSDPLIFYRAIAELGNKNLTASGKIYVEVHENRSYETAEIFRSSGYRLVEIRKDMQGKDRMVRASRHE